MRTKRKLGSSGANRLPARGRGWASAAVMLLACVFLLTSCAQGEAHLTIHKNATADFALNISLPDKAMDLIGKPELLQETAERLTNDQMKVRTYEKDGQQVLEGTRHFSLKEIEPHQVELPDGIEEVHDAEKHFFYTKYHIRITVDTDKLIGKESASENLSDMLSSLSPIVKKLVLSQLNFDVKVTFPLKPGANNAPQTEDGGRTLVWPFSFTEPNRYEIDFNAPNVKNLLLVGIPALLAAAGGAAWLIVRYRRGKHGKSA
ncbi:hypothetical protein [Cohnella sp. AR92]|uniref:hypothetical protein n=1 Tax=Cohnella sp. AR92 TaxID=648716 RepID=UPI000F8F24BB|nr:hypothetical protein [Cohnella sp. AR92]RUS45014.1 hypothetical protein ELR57_20960 [Cohnella sp. AR92]